MVRRDACAAADAAAAAGVQDGVSDARIRLSGDRRTASDAVDEAAGRHALRERPTDHPRSRHRRHRTAAVVEGPGASEARRRETRRPRRDGHVARVETGARAGVGGVGGVARGEVVFGDEFAFAWNIEIGIG